jgi:hypothetical protein
MVQKMPKKRSLFLLSLHYALVLEPLSVSRVR